MYNSEKIKNLVSFITINSGIADKIKLSLKVQNEFNLIRDRSVFYCDDFAIRFCKTKSKCFSNTVLSLSTLQKYDNVPFIVCAVTSDKNYMLLANATFLRKISHSSQDLRIDNIKGSFNGSDIMSDFEGISNEPQNFEFLFTSHENYSFNENLERLVAATNNIQPIKEKFLPDEKQISCILNSVERAKKFLTSNEYKILNDDLCERVNSVASEIVIAAFIDNVNLRGRIIEYLITSADDLRCTLIDALRTNKPLPEIYTSDDLGDYERKFEYFDTETDIKTKILFLSSNPKGYNIDKLLSFLATEKSVYLIYVIAIDEHKNISTRLCSMYNNQILNGTRIIKHWAGRNSRGVTQYDGSALESVIFDFDNSINISKARELIKNFLNA